jgi:D-amino-acid dehydrogenase
MLLKSMGWLLDSSSPLHIQPSLSPGLIRWLWHFLRAMNRAQMLRSIEVLTDLSKISVSAYAALAENSKTHALQFQKKGLLMVSATEAGVRAAIAEMDLMAKRDIPGQAMSRDQVLAFEPTLRSQIQGGVYFPEEAQLDPYLTSLALAESFEAAGGTIISNAEAYDFVASQGRISEVHTTQGAFSADLVLLATGSWSPELARKLKIRIPIRGGKGYSMTLRGVSKKPSRSIMIVDRKIAVTPFTDRLRVAGTLELVDQDFSISVSRLNAIHQGTHEYLDLGVEKADQTQILAAGSAPVAQDIWRGLRPCTPDGVPLIGFSKHLSNLFYCTGHQMLGLQTAPGSARLAADLILGRSPCTKTEPFAPARFE